MTPGGHPKLTPLAIRLIEQHEADCETTLARVWDRVSSRGAEPVNHHTPLDEVIGREGMRGLDVGSKKTAEQKAREAEEWAIRRSAIDQMLEYIFADGPRPDRVVRRIYSLVKAQRSDLILDMSYEELALLVGETKAAQQWRFGQVIEGKLREAGFLGIKFPHQKGASTSDTYAAVQRGNSNRRGGKKSESNKNGAHP